MRTKSPTNCDAHLAESLFQTRSSLLHPSAPPSLFCLFHRNYLPNGLNKIENS
ncbi:DUF6783 domain-containing protein [Blautia acetigignens]|uniref:DUF6783 domain-containing protein n=1 Tax=Blautia acetigignens TaxID=2981783 RepID=UPI002FE6E958